MSLPEKTVLFLFLTILPFACSSLQETVLDPVMFQTSAAQMGDWASEQAQLQCTSWRVAVEANNLSPWRTIPEECGVYVEEYMTAGKGYEIDLQTVSNEAGRYARNVSLSGDGKDVWVFDVDETLISNLHYYAQHGYGYVVYGFVHGASHVVHCISCWMHDTWRVCEVQIDALGGAPHIHAACRASSR
ncbi:hypothetical protein OROMI_015323 [Orobanche minor]